MGIEQPNREFIAHSIKQLQKGAALVFGVADMPADKVLGLYIDGDVLDWRKLL